MRIIPEPGDAPYLVEQVETLANAIAERCAPQFLLVLKVKSWFGLRWLGYSGGVYPQVPQWKKTLTVPPFLPSRITSQRRFSAPAFAEVAEGRPLHVSTPGFLAPRRIFEEIEPRAAALWFNGDSESAGKGSLMAYIPESSDYTRFYCAYSAENGWHLHRVHGISRTELQGLIRAGERETVVPA